MERIYRPFSMRQGRLPATGLYLTRDRDTLNHNVPKPCAVGV